MLPLGLILVTLLLPFVILLNGSIILIRANKGPNLCSLKETEAWAILLVITKAKINRGFFVLL